MSARPVIKWTDDCQGKMDYDGGLIRVSTRYWPRGDNYFLTFDTLPSASCKILINDGGDQCNDDYWSVLFEQEFVGENGEAVRAAVEEWVRKMAKAIFNRVVLSDIEVEVENSYKKDAE